MRGYCTYTLYDEEYMGPGYFIIQEFNGEIEKFIKIFTTTNYGFSHYMARAYEKDVVDLPDQTFREIAIIARNEEEALYEIISELALGIKNEKILSIDPSKQGENNMIALYNTHCASLMCFKDVYGVKHATDFIDINLGDNYTCAHWLALNDFYQDLEKHTTKEADENDIQRILRMIHKY